VLHIRSLQQRFVIFVLLPVAALLVAMGLAGFVFARRSLLEEWEKAAVLKLQRAAHMVDMRLSRPKELIRLLQVATGNQAHALGLQAAVLKLMEASDGVLAVRLRPVAATPEPPGEAARPMMRGHGHGGMGGGQFRITAPRYDTTVDSQAVTLIATVSDAYGRAQAEVELTLDFRFLLEDLPLSDWYEARRSFLVDETGRILTSTAQEPRERLGDGGSRLELETLEALQSRTSGTVRGEGYPPGEVSGFYRLAEAPWNFVVFAPGADILATVIAFRNVYFATLGGFILIILALIRRVTGRTAAAVRELSAAAEGVAAGRYGEALPVTSRDEIGELTRSFNTMVEQLRERMRLKRSLDLAKEVQQNLLPQADPQLARIDVAGRSRFCDETGGDYYDYIQAPGTPGGGLHVVVGDVAGHGVSSALLMASVRASLRQRSAVGDGIGAIVSDVNRQITRDVGDSGRFMTLFYLALSGDGGELNWVRAGHDPGLFYAARNDDFHELYGEGLALGVDPDFRYQENRRLDLQPGDLILVGTDGIWESRSPEGEMFGKRRWQEVVHRHRDGSAAGILEAVFQALDLFTASARPHDDMTLIVAKIR
jgi:sigma-B regulation protein RsbU (phosphoserine phosphatase)